MTEVRMLWTSAMDFRLLVDIDGEEVDLCDLLPVTEVSLKVTPSEAPAVMLRLELEGMSTDASGEVKVFTDEAKLRQIAEVLGFELLPARPRCSMECCGELALLPGDRCEVHGGTSA